MGATLRVAPRSRQAICQGTMFEWCSMWGDQHLVPGLDPGAPEAGGDEVDPLGGAADEDDLLAAFGVEELGDAAACALVGERRLLREPVDPAVDVGVLLLVVAGHRGDDGARLLRRRGVVEIDQRLVPHPPREDGEVAPYRFDVELIAGCRRLNDHPPYPPEIRRPTLASASARRCARSCAGPTPVDDLAAEGTGEHAHRLGPGNGARLQVEQGVFVQLASGRGVAAAHVVGVDLELRLRGDVGVVRQQQVLVRLVGVGVLGASMHVDPAAEDAGGSSPQHPLVELVAGAVGPRVLDGGEVVDMLAAGAEIEPVQRRFDPLSGEHGDGVPGAGSGPTGRRWSR